MTDHLQGQLPSELWEAFFAAVWTAAATNRALLSPAVWQRAIGERNRGCPAPSAPAPSAPAPSSAPARKTKEPKEAGDRKATTTTTTTTTASSRTKRSMLDELEELCDAAFGATLTLPKRKEEQQENNAAAAASAPSGKEIADTGRMAFDKREKEEEEERMLAATVGGQLFPLVPVLEDTSKFVCEVWLYSQEPEVFVSPADEEEPLFLLVSEGGIQLQALQGFEDLLVVPFHQVRFAEHVIYTLGDDDDNNENENGGGGDTNKETHASSSSSSSSSNATAEGSPADSSPPKDDPQVEGMKELVPVTDMIVAADLTDTATEEEHVLVLEFVRAAAKQDLDSPAQKPTTQEDEKKKKKKKGADSEEGKTGNEKEKEEQRKEEEQRCRVSLFVDDAQAVLVAIKQQLEKMKSLKVTYDNL